MEDQSASLIDYVPSFARGVHVLLIHDDRDTLNYLTSLLEQYSFKVDGMEDTYAAASMICDNEGVFKLVMAKAKMPGLDVLGLVMGKDIPLILIGGCNDRVVSSPNCLTIEPPIRLDDLKHIWKNVLLYRSSVVDSSHSQKEEETITNNTDLKMKNKVYGGENWNRVKLRLNRTTVFKGVIPAGNYYNRKPIFKLWPSYCYDEKRGGATWTTTKSNEDKMHLQLKLLKTIHALGLGDEDGTHQKWITGLMNDPGMTFRDVSSPKRTKRWTLKGMMQDAEEIKAKFEKDRLATKDQNLPAAGEPMEEDQHQQPAAATDLDAHLNTCCLHDDDDDHQYYSTHIQMLNTTTNVDGKTT